MPRPLKICLIAGEASGDLLGADLMVALKSATASEIRFIGVGGTAMSAEGLTSLFPMTELSIMGLAEVLPKARQLLARIKETQNYILREQPDVIVTIDAPSFNFRVIKKLTQSGIPRVHYVAPQAWAWRPWRAKELKHLYDRVLALLPFEPAFFETYGVEARFVGHPVVARIAQERAAADPNRLRQDLGIEQSENILLVLPGSRNSETKRLLPIFSETVRRLRADGQSFACVMPTVPAVSEAVAAHVKNWAMPVHVVTDQSRHKDAFVSGYAALAASGTVSLELLLHGVPSIIGYRVNPVTASILKRLLQTDFVSLANILCKEEIMPEYLQKDCTPEMLAPALQKLLEDGTERDRQLQAADRVATLLSGGSEGTPSSRAAAHVLSLIS